jgi:uncharacterized protein
MAVFAISDLHLSFAKPKPMDIFGEQWADHPARIAAAWDSTVGRDDIVLLPGDHSWAMRTSEAMPDLEYIASRPGKKLMVRGNHDYWWNRQATSKIQKKIQKMVDPSITLLQGASIVFGRIGIAGTRGWRLGDPESPEDEQADLKIYERELTYLERALKTLPEDLDLKIAMLHYPPFTPDLEPNDFAAILETHSVDILVYGHLHSGPFLEGDVGGIQYHLVAADRIGFAPRLIVG